jgi:hypothetical protein
MRYPALILTLLLPLALAACGGKQPAASSPSGGASAPLVLAAAAGGTAPQGSAAPAAAAAPAGGQVLVMEGATPTLGSDGSLTVAGKILNTSEGEARATTIVLELLDASGQRVARTTFANLALPTLKPGDRVAWQGRFNLPPKDWATVRATVMADGEGGQ